MALPLHNYLLGKIGPDQVPCALIAESDLDKAYEDLKARLGRDTYPGELYAEAAEQLGVDRIVSVFCPPGAHLPDMLLFIGPDHLRAKQPLHQQTLSDLQQEDFTVDG